MKRIIPQLLFLLLLFSTSCTSTKPVTNNGGLPTSEIIQKADKINNIEKIDNANFF